MYNRLTSKSLLWSLVTLTILGPASSAWAFEDPATGRWMTRDPDGYVNGANPYVFNGDNPNRSSDPTGRIIANPGGAHRACCPAVEWGRTCGGIISDLPPCGGGGGSGVGGGGGTGSVDAGLAGGGTSSQAPSQPGIPLPPTTQEGGTEGPVIGGQLYHCAAGDQASKMMSGGGSFARQLYLAIIAAGCTPPGPVMCKRCNDDETEAGRWQYWNNTIVICDPPEDGDDLAVTIEHELWHALQFCDLDRYYVPGAGASGERGYREFEAYWMTDCRHLMDWDAICACAERGAEGSCRPYCGTAGFYAGIAAAKAWFGCP
jgi:hypothetical protein